MNTTVIKITDEEVEQTIPRVGDRVRFTTENNELLVANTGIVKDVSIIENRSNCLISHRLYVIEADNGEYYPVHTFFKNKRKDTVILLDKERMKAKGITLNVGAIKNNAMYTNDYYEQEAKRLLPSVGDHVCYTVNINGEIIDGVGKVLRRRVRNAKNLEAFFTIINEENKEIEVYHNSDRSKGEKVIKL